MHKLQRLIASLGVIAILSTLVISTAYAALPSDVPADEWYTPFVQELVDAEAIDATAKFNPSANTTRCEWVKWQIIFNGLELPAAELPTVATFTDVPKDNACFQYVETAYHYGIVSGYKDAEGELTGFFGPNDPVTREQAAKIIIESQALPIVEDTGIFPDEASFSDWFVDANYGSTIYAWSVMVGDSTTGKFRPQDKINHAEAAKVITIEPVLQDVYVTGDDDDDVVEGDDVVAEAGELAVSLGEVLEAATLPSGATSVKMLNVDVTAGEGGATLESLQIHRFGVSSLPANHSVYLYEGSERLTSGKSINSTTNLATFNNLNLDVAAGETRHLTVRMDVGTVATTGEIGLEVASEESVDAGESTVALDGEVQGEKFGLSTTSAGTITITKNGTTSNASVGEKGATIAKFKMAATTEKASLEEFGLYIGGTVSVDDVVNLKLYASGVTDPIAEVEAINSNDVAQFVMAEPYEIEKGDTKSFTVTAEFNTGRSGDTVFAYVYENTDVVAIGGTYGYGMAVARGDYDGDAAGVACAVAAQTVCNAMALEGGDITIAGTSISNRNMAVNQDDVVVLKFSVTAVSEVTFDNFAITLDTGAAAEAISADAGLWQDSDNAANFTDIKIKEIDGDHTWGPVDSDVLTQTAGGDVITDATDTAAGYTVFTDDLTLEAGESKDFEMTLDVRNEANLSNETLTAAIYIAGSYPAIKDANNKTLTNSTSLVPTSTYTGDQFTVKTDSLTITKGSAIGSKTVVVGSEDVEIGAFSVGAGDASSIKITSISLTGYIDSDGGGFTAGADATPDPDVSFSEEVLGMNLYKGSVSAENKLNATAKGSNSTTGVVTFDNLSWEIEAGDTENLIVTADQIANNTNYNADRVKVDIADVSADIIAENGDGNTITSNSSDTPNGSTTDSSVNYIQITISSGGTLAVDVKSPTAASDIIVAGTTGNDMGSLKFISTQEAFVIDKMALRNSRPDYDDNLSALHVNYYTDAAQTTAGSTSCTLSSVATVWLCTGMSMYVPNPDLVGNPNYAYMDITADLKSLANSAADAGDAPLFTFTPAGDFEATGVSSPTKIYEETLLVEDLGASSYYVTSADMTVVANYLNEALDVSETLIDLAGVATAYPVGTIICIDAANSGDCGAADEIVYVLAACTAADVPHDECTAANQVVVKRGILGRTAATALITDNIFRLSSASVLATNAMSVYGTKLAFAAGTPTHGGQNTTEEVMKFTVTPNANGDAKMRAGIKLSEATIANASIDSALDATNAETVQTEATTIEPSGTSVELLCTVDLACDNNDGVGIDYGALGTLSTYNYVGFWFQWTDAAGAVALPADDLSATLNAAAVGGVLFSTPQAFGAAATTYTEGLWYYKEFAISGFASGATQDRWFVVAFADAGLTAVNDTIWIDDIKFYNEKLFIDLSTNATGVVGGTTAYLKQNGDIVATGNAVFKSATLGSILFTPVAADYGDITLSGTDTFTVEMNTVQLANSTSTESLTANIDLGGYGTTTGDVYWYDEEGNSELTWAGKTSTDKVSNTISW